MATDRSPIEFSSQSCALLPPCPIFQGHPLPHSAALMPIFSSCYVSRCNPIGGSSLAGSVLLLRSRAWFSSTSSSTQPPDNKGFNNYKLPPVNPPDRENPDAVTLRAQWDSAVRLYARMYSHAWGTAILAGVTLFGIGWWVKGDNPLKVLSPSGEIKKEEATD